MRKRRICAGKAAVVLMSLMMISTCIPVWAGEPGIQEESTQQTIQITQSESSTDEETGENVVVLEVERSRDDSKLTYQWQKKESADHGKSFEWKDIAGKKEYRIKVPIPLAGQGDAFYRCVIVKGEDILFSEEEVVQELQQEEVTEAEEEPKTEEVKEAEEEPKTEEVTEAEEEPKTEEVKEAEEEPKTEEVTEAEEEPKTEEVKEAEEEPKTEEVKEAEEEPKTEEVTEAEEEPKTEEVKEPEEIPEEVEVSLTTDTEITVKSVDGYAYSIDGGKTWQKQGYFHDLQPDTSYKILIGVWQEDGSVKVFRDGGVEVKTKKAVSEIPKAPVLLEKTDTMISVETIEGQEYTIDKGVSWQSTGTFQGLLPDTDYEIYTRVKETEEHVSSQASEPLLVKTEKTPLPVPDKAGVPELLERTDTKISVKTVEGQEYSIDGGKTWRTDGKFESLTAGTSYKVVTRVRETEKNQAGILSDPLNTATKAAPPKAPAKPELLERSQTVLKVKGGENLEYSIDGGKSWQDGETFEGLKAETGYEIICRVKETEDAMPGLVSEALWAETLRMPWIPDPSESVIYGIQKNGYYTVGSQVSFEAIGAGMDNESPIYGDVRYLPAGWKYRGERKNWEQSPYKASVTLKYAGKHTISVFFDKQIYDGSKWKASGEYYERTLSLTAGRTPRTGDDNQAGVLAGLFLISGVALLSVCVKMRYRCR